MFLENLVRSVDDKKTLRIINLVIFQLNMLLCLVNDVLDIKQIGLSKFEPKLSEFSPLGTLEFILAMFKPQAEMQGTQLSFETVSSESLRFAFRHGHQKDLMSHQDLPETLEGDSLRLQQILINLTKNALKFSIRCSVRIIMAYDYTYQMLRVHIHDTGKGILEEDMPKLFSLFGKLKRTAEINSEGIGMGLMICQNLVKMNGGSIEVHSDGENKGSVFSFSMKMSLRSYVRRECDPEAGDATGGTNING